MACNDVGRETQCKITADSHRAEPREWSAEMVCVPILFHCMHVRVCVCGGCLLWQCGFLVFRL